MFENIVHSLTVLSHQTISWGDGPGYLAIFVAFTVGGLIFTGPASSIVEKFLVWWTDGDDPPRRTTV